MKVHACVLENCAAFYVCAASLALKMDQIPHS